MWMRWRRREVQGPGELPAKGLPPANAPTCSVPMGSFACWRPLPVSPRCAWVGVAKSLPRESCISRLEEMPRGV